MYEYIFRFLLHILSYIHSLCIFKQVVTEAFNDVRVTASVFSSPEMFSIY